MPLIKLETSVQLTEEKKKTIAMGLSSIVAQGTGKPEQYVMTTVSAAEICMAGKTGPAAFVDVRSIGSINGKVNNKISKDVKAFLEKEAGIQGDRVYLNFTDVPAGNWGWNGSTFG
jgi:phenylpyruvate tautomerase PptA (4-oxalocrotonate tautomerase family)